MTDDVVLILTEAALTAADVEHLMGIYRDPDGDGVPDPLAFRVLVPADPGRHLLSSLITHLGSGELREAWHELTAGDETREGVASAAEQLQESLDALAGTGVPVTGMVIEEDPVPGLRTAIAEGGVREVVVITYPHPFEDTFRTDWASKARGALPVPVLHLYAGTSEVG